MSDPRRWAKNNISMNVAIDLIFFEPFDLIITKQGIKAHLERPSDIEELSASI